MVQTSSSPLLAAALQREIDKRGLQKITAAAKIVGVGKRDLRMVLTQQRKPNKRTFEKYARFLKMTTSAIEAMVEAAPGGGNRERVFFSDEVDTAVRVIQDIAVSAVVGRIRPDLVRELSKLDASAQEQVFAFVESLAVQTPPPVSAPVKQKQAKTKPSPAKKKPRANKTGAHVITSQRLADLSARRKRLRDAAQPRTSPRKLPTPKS